MIKYLVKNKLGYYIVYFFGFVLGFSSHHFWAVLVGLGSYIIFDIAFIFGMPKALKLIVKDLKEHGN